MLDVEVKFFQLCTKNLGDTATNFLPSHENVSLCPNVMETQDVHTKIKSFTTKEKVSQQNEEFTTK